MCSRPEDTEEMVLDRDDVIERVERGEEKVWERRDSRHKMERRAEALSLERLGWAGWLSESSASSPPYHPGP